MIDERTAELLRSAYTALDAGEVEEALEFLDPEVEYVHDPNAKFERGTYRGREEVGRYWRRWLEAWNTYRLEPERLMELPDGRVLVFVTFAATGSESGLPVEFPIAQMITLREGRISHVRTYVERTEALEAAGLDE